MLGLYVALSVYISYLLQSKLTLLSVLTVLLVLIAVRVVFKRNHSMEKYRHALIMGTFGLLLSFGAVAWFLGNQSTTRLSLWSEASTAHTTVPEVLFGSGPNTFLYNPFTVESGFDKGELVIPWVHNLYLEAYFDEGMLGLFAILALTVIPLLRAFRIKDKSARALILTSTVTFFLVALFEITLTRRFYFAFLALLYGLSIAQTQEVENVQTN
jgi:O-antigen ligase